MAMRVYNNFSNAFRSPIGKEEFDDVNTIRVLNWKEINKGDHIIMKCDDTFINIGGIHISLGTDHVIVKDVLPIVDGYTALVAGIHFYTTPFNMICRIHDKMEMLELQRHEVYVVRYRNPTHNPNGIVERAEAAMASNDNAHYCGSLACKRFCEWCCVG